MTSGNAKQLFPVPLLSLGHLVVMIPWSSAGETPIKWEQNQIVGKEAWQACQWEGKLVIGVLNVFFSALEGTVFCVSISLLGVCCWYTLLRHRCIVLRILLPMS